MITYHGHNSRHDNPVYNMHKNVDVHYTQQNTGIPILAMSTSKHGEVTYAAHR